MLEVLTLRFAHSTRQTYNPVFPKDSQEHLPNVRELTLQRFGACPAEMRYRIFPNMRDLEDFSHE